jgi:hypothetical protein
MTLLITVSYPHTALPHVEHITNAAPWGYVTRVNSLMRYGGYSELARTGNWWRGENGHSMVTIYKEME